MRKLLLMAAAGVAFLASNTCGHAQDFPSKPITIVVGLAAGGITDITARIYAEAVSRSIGQRVSVENKPGAGGAVGAAAVQNAAPDGYTLLVFSGSQHATIAAAGPAPYEPVKGFAPVTLLFNSVVALTVPADSPGEVGRRTVRHRQEEGRWPAVRHAGPWLAVASARRAAGARGQGSDPVDPLSRWRADDGGSRHRTRRLGVADAVDGARLSRGRQAEGACARRRPNAGASCRMCRP